MKQYPDKRFNDSELEQLTGLPKVTVSNAYHRGYINRDDSSQYYYPENDEVDPASTQATSNIPVEELSEDQLISKAIQRKILYHQEQIEKLKDLLKTL